MLNACGYLLTISHMHSAITCCIVYHGGGWNNWDFCPVLRHYLCDGCLHYMPTSHQYTHFTRYTSSYYYTFYLGIISNPTSCRCPGVPAGNGDDSGYIIIFLVVLVGRYTVTYFIHPDAAFYILFYSVLFSDRLSFSIDLFYLR